MSSCKRSLSATRCFTQICQAVLEIEHAPYLITSLIMKCAKISYTPLLGTVHEKLLINSKHKPIVKTQSHIQYVPGLKQPWRETDPSPLTMALIKYECSSAYTIPFLLSTGTIRPLQQLTPNLCHLTHHSSCEPVSAEKGVGGGDSNKPFNF